MPAHPRASSPASIPQCCQGRHSPGPAPAPLPAPGPAPSPFPYSSAPPKLRKEPLSPGCRELTCLQRNKPACFIQPSSLVPFPAFSKYNKTSAPLPQLSPGWNQDHFSLMLADMEWHKGSTENAVTAFHICPYCLFFASTSNQSTAFAGQQRTSYSCPLRREIKLGWLFTDLISWFINPTFKTEQMAHLPVASW